MGVEDSVSLATESWQNLRVEFSGAYYTSNEDYMYVRLIWARFFNYSVLCSPSTFSFHCGGTIYVHRTHLSILPSIGWPVSILPCMMHCIHRLFVRLYMRKPICTNNQYVYRKTIWTIKFENVILWLSANLDDAKNGDTARCTCIETALRQRKWHFLI